ncbi:MAG TPA: 7-cyano-7-deazaguanine synthase QueC [Anaerolineae bacterium]|nr:7-cyano-7-deazaguanine synthase QueC [Anaerolineae bacterium]
MSDCIAVVSGGMDSITLLYYLVKRKRRLPALLTFSYGQKHGKEIEFARYHAQRLGCRDHRVLDLSLLAPVFSGSSLVSSALAIPDAETVLDDPQPSTYVPNRNMVFLSIAVAYAETREVPEVYYGAQRHDQPGYWDASPDFVDQMNAVLGLNRRNTIRIQAPFAFNSKADIVRLGFELGVDFGKTWSCFRGGEMACGVCSSCVERLRAFDEMGLRDPLPYASPTMVASQVDQSSYS